MRHRAKRPYPEYPVMLTAHQSLDGPGWEILKGRAFGEWEIVAIVPTKVEAQAIIKAQALPESGGK